MSVRECVNELVRKTSSLGTKEKALLALYKSILSYRQYFATNRIATKEYEEIVQRAYAQAQQAGVNKQDINAVIGEAEAFAISSDALAKDEEIRRVTARLLKETS